MTDIQKMLGYMMLEVPSALSIRLLTGSKAYPYTHNCHYGAKSSLPTSYLEVRESHSKETPVPRSPLVLRGPLALGESSALLVADDDIKPSSQLAPSTQ